MSWSITDYFPSWGDGGEQPSSGFNYQGGDQVNEKHLDYLWSSLHDLQEEVQAALDDIDSDSDGVVDKAEAGAANFTLDGDLVAAGGEVIWDESSTYVPQNRLENDSVTVTAGDGLKGGGSVALGGSTALNVEPSDFAGSGLQDDGNDNLEVTQNVPSSTQNATAPLEPYGRKELGIQYPKVDSPDNSEYGFKSGFGLTYTPLNGFYSEIRVNYRNNPDLDVSFAIVYADGSYDEYSNVSKGWFNTSEKRVVCIETDNSEIGVSGINPLVSGSHDHAI